MKYQTSEVDINYLFLGSNDAPSFKPVDERMSHDALLSIEIGKDGFPMVPSQEELDEIDLADQKRFLRTYLNYSYSTWILFVQVCTQ